MPDPKPTITRTQRMAMRAAASLETANPDAEYRSFARSFPSLIHTSGLCSALAYSFTKSNGQLFVDHLAEVLSEVGYGPCEDGKELQAKVRDLPMPSYVQISRDALTAAGFLKRYAEALVAEDDNSES